MKTVVMISKDVKTFKITEARVSVYNKGHDQPVFHIPINKKLNLTGWLSKVLHFLNYLIVLNFK